MKRIFTILLVGSLSTLTFAQGISSVEIIDGTTETNYAGTTVEITGNTHIISRQFYMKNTGETDQFFWGRSIKHISSDSYTVQLCDEMVCYDTSGEFWTGPSSVKTIYPGEMVDFKPQLTTYEIEGSAEVVYYVLDGQKSKIDSLTVIYTIEESLSIDKQDRILFNVFPNPAQNEITIESDGLNGGGTAVIMDALGKEIKEIDLKGNHSKVNIAELKRGVYFIHLYNKNGVKSTTQRIIKQ